MSTTKSRPYAAQKLAKPKSIRKPGRPAAAATRSSRLQMRTYPDIVAKAQRIGTEAIEQLIRDCDL